MIIYDYDDEASLELLSPAGRRALNGNGSAPPIPATSRAKPDLREDIFELQRKVAKLEDRRPPPRGMTRSDAEDLVAALANVISELNARIEALEKRPEVKWYGVWREQMNVPPGSILTDRGSLWIATEASNGARPGESPCFKLICKNGYHSEDRKHRTATRSAPSMGR